MAVFFTDDQAAAVKIKFQNGIQRVVWVSYELNDIFSSFKYDENSAFPGKEHHQASSFPEKTKQNSCLCIFVIHLTRQKLTCGSQTASVCPKI